MIYDHNLTNDTLGPFAVGEWSKKHFHYNILYNDFN